MTNKQMKLSAPWMIFYREMEAMFSGDPDIMLDYDEDNQVITLFVESEKKRDALAQLLPAERTFGNIVVKVKVVPANSLDSSKSSLFRAAFEGNPAFVQAEDVTGFAQNPMTFVVFQKKVVQFFTDNAGDLHGLRSTLYQDIARDIFGEMPGVYYNTHNEDS